MNPPCWASETVVSLNLTITSTAIDDATRSRALKVYPRHTQKNAMQFLDHVIDTFPFRIHTGRTDRGHALQAQFHWHLADRGIRHVYIKPRTPRLNGKVELLRPRVFLDT